MSETITRRAFAKTGAAAAVASFAAPYLVDSSALGAFAPSKRINLGVIGTGTRGTPDMEIFMNNPDVRIVAICDVNTSSLGYRDPKRPMGRLPALEIVNKHYAAKQRSGSFKGVDAYNDFRKIIQRDDVDAVAIVTPDHWHGVMTIMAAQAGKDIFCQKPLSLTIRQGQEMIKAVRKHQRILQTGSQFRSSPTSRHACELVLNGRIGKLKTIRTYLAFNNRQDPGPGWKPMPVPQGFDYESWLGPAPKVPYHEARCIYAFRFGLDYSGGQMTNFGAHSNDIAQWGNGTSLTGPVEIEGLHSKWPPEGSLFSTALEAKFRARYANGVELICESKDPGLGVRFEGTEGWIELPRFHGIKTSPESLVDSKIGPNEIHLPVSIPERTENVYGNYCIDHIRNFLNCVKTRAEPIEPVEIGHRTASLCHLGNIALKLMRKLEWDPDREQFPHDDEANKMVSRVIRPPWRL